MKAIEKRDYIHSHLHFASETMLDEIYRELKRRELLKANIEEKAHLAEEDITEGRLFSREQVEEYFDQAD